MKFRKFSLVVYCFSIFLFTSCGSSKEEEKTLLQDTTMLTRTLDSIPLAKDTILFFSFAEENDISCTILYPEKKAEGSILLLHGWNLAADEICKKTSFCEKAKAANYVLIMPDFGKSNYCLEVYPQTIDAYTKYPSLQWMMDVFIPTLQKEFYLLKEEQLSFVYGISTGARGASLFAYHLPEIFDAAACLSGDFDINDFTDAYIYYSFLGKQEDFPERWEKQAFVNDCQNYTVPTYIGHGKKDSIIAVLQSEKMYDSIKKHQKTLEIQAHFPEEGKHDYEYWESETDNILNFFHKIKKDLLLK